MALTSSTKVEIGSNAHRFNLPGADGKNYSLNDFKNKKGLVIAFTCNHCPYAQAAWPLLTNLAEKLSGKDIAFVAINPNDESQYPEDSFEEMKKRIKDWNINFPYLRDKSQQTAKDYGAVCTPDVFVYNRNHKLFYHGRINDNWQHPEDVKEKNLEDALGSLLEESSPPKNQPPSMGCSIKWKN